MKKRILNAILTAGLIVFFTLLIEHGTNAFSGFRESAFGYGLMFLTIFILQQFRFFNGPKSLSESIAEKEKK